MKKSALLCSTLLAIGASGLLGGIVHADTAVNGQPTVTAPSQPKAGIIFLDKGEFDGEIRLIPYSYTLNQAGMSTGQVILTYNSVALADIGLGENKYFNLKLPKEFDVLATMNGGENLKNVITAQYKLPGHAEFSNVEPEEINTSFAGEIGFQLKGSWAFGSTTVIKISIDYGKILDGLPSVGPTTNFKNFVADAKGGAYEFRGVMTNNELIDVFPDTTTAVGMTDGNEACVKPITQQ